jgi:hypothetical protein
VKPLVLRRPDRCVSCRKDLPAGTRAAWDARTRTVRCRACAPLEPLVRSVPSTDTGSGGASAAQEYERRSRRREAQIRSAHPRLGGLILALTDEPASTRVWAQGAAGERAVAATLDELRGDHLAVLHDRALRRSDGRPSRANLDHIAVAASGVWIVDAKTHQGALQVRRSGGLLSPRVERLYIGGRDRTKLLEGLHKQVVAVCTELLAVGADIPVRGAMCFVGTELPWFGSSSIAGVPLVGRRGLAKLLKSPGDLSRDDRQAVAEFLGTRFVPAAP